MANKKSGRRKGEPPQSALVRRISVDEEQVMEAVIAYARRATAVSYLDAVEAVQEAIEFRLQELVRAFCLGEHDELIEIYVADADARRKGEQLPGDEQST